MSDLKQKLDEWQSSPNGRAVQFLTIDDVDEVAEIAHRSLSAPDPRDALIDRLVEAAAKLQADMLERAELKVDVIRGEQYRVVNAGNTAWTDFCAALAAVKGAGK